MAPCSKCGRAPPHPKARFCPICGSMLAAPAELSDPWLGQSIGGRYRVVAALGQGGMGRVYLAEQQMGTITRRVAVKTLPPDLAAAPMVAARFNREAETVIGLTHPNTITFHDFGQTDDGTFYIVMEYIEGESLARLVSQGALRPERAEYILGQICASLHEAHEQGIVHRDLKPENIILTQRVSQRDVVKVLDFGIAKRTGLDADSLKLTKAGVVLGTPPYMSPEQFDGQPLDRRSDIYSLGVMTYEMLTGRLPFKGKTAWEWATQHMSAAPEPFESTPAGRAVPPGLRQPVFQALSKRPDQRPATALDYIEAYAAGRATGGVSRPSAPTAPGVTAPEPAPEPQPQRPPSGERSSLPRTQHVPTHRLDSRRTRWGWIIAAVCLIMMGVGVAVGAALYHLGLTPAPSWLGGGP